MNRNLTSFALAVIAFASFAASGRDTSAEGIPAARLHQNAPNPFNLSTTIPYELGSETAATLSIYSLEGRRIAVLDRGSRPAGRHEVRWDGRDAGGSLVPSGIYFYRLQTGTHSETRKLMFFH